MSESPSRSLRSPRYAPLASFALLLLTGCGTRSILGRPLPEGDVVEETAPDAVITDTPVAEDAREVAVTDTPVARDASDVTIPDVALLDVPDVTIPDVALLDVPDVTIPDVTVPDVTLPDAPDATVRDVTLLDVRDVVDVVDIVDVAVDAGPAGPGILGSAARFTILAGSTVSNLGFSMVVGEVGVSPGTALVGIPAGTVVHAGTPVAALAQSDTTIAYNNLAGLPCGTTLTGRDLGGMTLAPGVYCFSSSAQLTGTVFLDGQGQPNPLFIFQIGSTLITSNAAAVVMINGARPCGVYWQTGSSATIGIASRFAGNIIAFASVTLTTGVSLNGRALARTGAVTMETNMVSNASCPDPAFPTGADAGATDAAPSTDRPDAASDARDD